MEKHAGLDTDGNGPIERERVIEGRKYSQRDVFALVAGGELGPRLYSES